MRQLDEPVALFHFIVLTSDDKKIPLGSSFSKFYIKHGEWNHIFIEHTVFSIHLHSVWITKYRKKLLTDRISFRVRDMIQEIRRQEDVDIIKGDVSQDRIHLFVSLPPQVTVSRFVRRVKGKTLHKLLGEFLIFGKHAGVGIFGRGAISAVAVAM